MPTPVGRRRDPPGPAASGSFMRSHENSRYAWSDAMMSSTAKATLYLIDKEALEIARTLTPGKGCGARRV